MSNSNYAQSANEKIIEKIKKLLELTTSPNENEAKLAMEQAQKLMLRHSIDYLNLQTESNAQKISSCVYFNPAFSKKSTLIQASKIIKTITPIFGVYHLVYTTGPTINKFELYGFPTNLEIAKFALDSVLAQGQIEARAKYKEFRTTVFSESFWSGFASGLATKFGNLPSSDSTALTVYDPIKLHVQSLSNGSYSGKSFDGVAYQAGMKSGQSVELRKGLQSSGNKGKLIQ